MDAIMSGLAMSSFRGAPRTRADALHDVDPRGNFSLRSPSVSSETPAIGFANSVQRIQFSNHSITEALEYDRAPLRRSSSFYKVLRFWQEELTSSLRSTRINSGFPKGNPLAVKGDALIHGPCLVARPVGSEWRTRRPRQTTTNQLTNH
jgi:hypothetical protein